jgi:pyridine nucleotide-disulfide oxidoreductase family protein
MKRLVLAGGGHAHVHVLKVLAAQPIPDTEGVLVTPFMRQVYSGMLPGWIAGHYNIDECVIPLMPLAQASKVRVIAEPIISLDANARTLKTESGASLDYDVLSLDIGSAPNIGNLQGDTARVITIRPIEHFITRMEAVIADCMAREGRGSVAVIGGGAGGMEVALALKYRLHDRAEITLIASKPTLPRGAQSRVMRALARAGVRVCMGDRVSRVTPDAVVLDHGETIAASHVIAAPGAKAHTWPAQSGLACDTPGYIEIENTLQSRSHPDVFAAGDCAAFIHHPRPKSGVYAVRAGPPLAENLRRALSGVALQTFVPQERALYLLATGAQHAIASWGAWSVEGRWVWRWKDHIDRAFMRRYQVGDA